MRTISDAKWNRVKANHPRESQVEGVVVGQTASGFIVSSGPSVTGFLKSHEVSWASERGFIKKNAISVGAIVYASVEECDDERQQLILSLRLFFRSSITSFFEAISTNDTVYGKVVSIRKDLIFVSIAEGPDAVLERRDLPDKLLDCEMEDIFKVGDSIASNVKTKDSLSYKLGLSLKGLLQTPEASFPRVSVKHQTPTQPWTKTANAGVALLPFERTSRPRRIILLDDDKDIAEQTQTFLSAAGHKVEAALHTASLKRRLEQTFFELIVADRTMADGSSSVPHILEMLRRDSRLKVIFVAGHYSESDLASLKSQAAEGQILDVIVKPVAYGLIYTAIERFTPAKNFEVFSHSSSAYTESTDSPVTIANVHGGLTLRQAIKDFAEDAASIAKKCSVFVIAKKPSIVDSKIVYVINFEKRLLEQSKYEWRSSPIGDVLEDGLYFRQENISKQHPGRSKKLLNFFSFNAMVGIPVHNSNKEVAYGLFLIAENEPEFTERQIDLIEYRAERFSTSLMELRWFEETVKDQARFLSGNILHSLIHEIRNAIHLMNGPLEELGRALSPLQDLDLKLEDALPKYKKLYGQYSQATDEFKQFLAIASADPSSPDRDLYSLVEQIASFFQFEAKRLSVNIQCFLSPSLMKCKVTELPLRLSLCNLILNALQHVEEGGELFISGKIGNSTKWPYEVRVIDSGVGIHRLNIENIFAPYFTTREEGTGIGLYLSRNLIEQTGGSLILEESYVQYGTSFLIRLPEKSIR